jgi:hypothetical protein
MKKKKLLTTSVIVFMAIMTACKGVADPLSEKDTNADSHSENDCITPTKYETIKPSIEPVPTYFNDPNVEEYLGLIHSAKEWLSKGYLDYPFSLNDYSYRDQEDYKEAYESVRFYIPQEALEQAATEDLVQLVGRMPKYPPNAYDFPSYYIETISSWFNAVDEMRTREDFAKVLLESYIKSEFMQMRSFEDSKQQFEYNVETSTREREILSKEIFLACNSTFDRMDDEMRRRTIEAVMEKVEIRQKEEFKYINSVSGFFAYVNELQNFEHEERISQDDETIEYRTIPPVGSKWYDYIAQTLQDDEIIEYIDSFWNGRYLP